MKNKTVFKGRLIDLIVKKMRLPNGYLATFETIKHPGAALIVPFLTSDKVIMLRQLRPVIGAYIYELPAGTLDKNEAPLSCAKREIVEETGYSSGEFKYLGKIFPVPGYSTECIHIYKANKLRKVMHKAEEDEVIKIHIFTRRKIRQLFKSGRIVDAKTISALAFVGWL